MQCCHLCHAGAPGPSDPLRAQQQAIPPPKGKAVAHELGAPHEAAAADGGLSAAAGPTGSTGGPSAFEAGVGGLEQVAGIADLDAAGQPKLHSALLLSWALAPLGGHFPGAPCAACAPGQVWLQTSGLQPS